jgi:type II secretion system protein D
MSFHCSLILLLLIGVTATGQQTADAPPAVNEPAAAAAAPPTPPVVVPPPSAPVPAVPVPAVPVPAVPTPAIPPPSVPTRPTTGGPAANPILPTDSATTARPAKNSAGPQPGIPLGENKIIDDIIEPKLSGNQLAGLYRQYTGRRVIVSVAASTAEFAFIQEASPKNPLTYAKAAELLKKAATIENFIFVPDGQDPNLDILTLATSYKPAQRGIDVYNENDELPEGDAVISYVMTLSYIKPEQAQAVFMQIVGTLGAFGSIAPVANASALIITENTSLIRKLIDLKKEIDKPSSQVATRFIKVQYADVTELAATLTELLGAQASAQKTAGIQRADAPAAAPAAPGVNIPRAAGQSGTTGSGEETPVQIIPEPRTNRIFAMGRPVDLLFVEGLISEFDVQTSDKIFLRRKLRFLTVSEFLPIAGDALTRAFTGTSEGGSKASGSATGGQSNNSRSSSSNSRSGSSNSRSGSSNSRTASNNSSSSYGGSNSYGGSSGMSGGSGGGGSSLSDPNVSSAPESLLVGRTLLVADNITNTIVAQGPPSGLEIIERLLDQIDVKPDQVMISTVIGKLSLRNEKSFGVDYLGLGKDFAGRGGSGSGPGMSILPLVGSAASGIPGTDAFIPAVPARGGLAPGVLSPSSGLQMYGKIGNMHVYLDALQKKTDFTVLSRPSIFTSNNQKGTISSGQRIAIPTGTNSYGGVNSGGSTQIQYQDVVLKLEVIPLVNSNNEITMQISLLNDQEGTPQVIKGGGPNGTDLTVPGINTQEILTTATVPNNETIVLGGLITSTNDQQKIGIPILCDIPLLGKLFSSNVNNKKREELLIFIQPSIVNSGQSLDDVQSAMNSRYKVSSDSRKFSDGSGVLPGVDDIPRLEKQPKATPPKAVVVPESAPAEPTKTRKSRR